MAQVKTTNDMLALMSDAYEVTPDFRMQLVSARKGVPPDVKLDGYTPRPTHSAPTTPCTSSRRTADSVHATVCGTGMYKFVDALQALVPDGPPSLIRCAKLSIEGKVMWH